MHIYKYVHCWDTYPPRAIASVNPELRIKGHVFESKSRSHLFIYLFHLGTANDHSNGYMFEDTRTTGPRQGWDSAGLSNLFSSYCFSILSLLLTVPSQGVRVGPKMSPSRPPDFRFCLFPLPWPSNRIIGPNSSHSGTVRRKFRFVGDLFLGSSTFTYIFFSFVNFKIKHSLPKKLSVIWRITKDSMSIGVLNIG